MVDFSLSLGGCDGAVSELSELVVGLGILFSSSDESTVLLRSVDSVVLGFVMCESCVPISEVVTSEIIDSVVDEWSMRPVSVELLVEDHVVSVSVDELVECWSQLTQK